MTAVGHVVLHRWIWANRLRKEFDKHIVTLGPPRTLADLDPGLSLTTDIGTFMSWWYAAPYVVVEGWRELSLHDEQIDGLLESENTDFLRRFRNAVCHFQKPWLDARMLEFCSRSGSVSWVRSLHHAFGRYFLAMYPATEKST